MRHALSEKNCRRIEQWAKKTNIHAILSLLETLPRKLHIPRKVLFGSKGAHEIYVEGMAVRTRLYSIIRTLDEPFNPFCRFTTTHTFEQRHEDIRGAILGPINTVLRAGFGKTCFQSCRGNCQGHIVRAHAIQEALLREHAIDGHLLHFNPFQSSTKGELRNWPAKIGVEHATTFHGFCSFHDNDIFKKIESDAFISTPETLFLYAYRSLCLSLYTSKYRYEAVKAPLAQISLTTPDENHSHIKNTLALNEINIKELSEIKDAWDNILESKQFTAIEHMALSCPKSPGIFATLFFAPSKNFRYAIIQNTKTLLRLEWISLSLIPRKNTGGILLISGTKGSHVWKKFTASLLEYPPDKRPIALFNYIICHFGEHIIISPMWWQKLPPENQEQIVNAWSAGYYPRHLKGPLDWGSLTTLDNMAV